MLLNTLQRIETQPCDRDKVTLIVGEECQPVRDCRGRKNRVGHSEAMPRAPLGRNKIAGKVGDRPIEGNCDKAPKQLLCDIFFVGVHAGVYLDPCNGSDTQAIMFADNTQKLNCRLVAAQVPQHDTRVE